MLEKEGISTIIEEGTVTNKLDTSIPTFYQAYAISRTYVENTLHNYANLKLIIDLHRDAIPRENSYIEINGVNYAKILFVQGVRYEKYEENMKLAKKISDKVSSKYPGMSKGIMIKDQTYQHDSYNQDLSTQAILLELGSNNNTWEEITNTISALAPIIKEVLYEES